MPGVQRQAAPLWTQVVGLLRDAIVSAEFAPGERLIERKLCDRFEVSRTVVREALRQLESEGLVEMVANHGPVVASLSVADAEALYEVREVLEAMTGRAFAPRATPAVDRGGLVRIVATLQAPGRSVHTGRELRAITDAATSGDAERAWAVCADHVRCAAVVAMDRLRAGDTADAGTA